MIFQNKTLFHYTWNGVLYTQQDFLVESVWEVELSPSEFEMALIADRAATLRDILPSGFGHWWFKATLWVFNRNQYLCTNFILSCLGRNVKIGLSPDELYTFLKADVTV